MYEAEFEMEAELENLMTILAESDLEAESEMTPEQRSRSKEIAGDQIRQGVTDENRLTDAVFYDLHPEWKDKKLPPNATRALKDAWREIRNVIVRPMVKVIPCSGWERDPESFSKRAAEHHLGGSSTVTRIVRTANPPNWACDVTVDIGDGSTVLTVQLVPAEKLVRVGRASDPSGQTACYRYRCLAANLVLEDTVCSSPAAQPELEAELEDLMGILEESDLESEAEVFAPPVASGPIFDLQCTTCAPGQCIACDDGLCSACPVAGGRCRTVLRPAIIEAIKLASNAADKLEAAISVEPGKRNKEARETARLFTAFFCHDPSLLIPWAGGPSGASVAERFRAVARELNGGRRIHFVCRPTRADCPDDETCCPSGEEAFTLDNRPSTLFLCDGFWNDAAQRQPGLPAVSNRAGTIIHEMLHVLFGAGIGKGRGILDADPKRANAHCYNAFALRVNGYGRDRVSTAGCGGCLVP